MVFSSLVFLFGFLPVSLMLYYASPVSWRNAVLLVVSLVFYAWGEPIYLTVMLVSILSTYLFGLAIGRAAARSPKWVGILTVLSVTVTLSFLFFFKYAAFFAGLLGLPRPSGIRLPIGISFYTFQLLSYTLDLRRGKITPQRDPIPFGTYVTLFPQLVAGPIVTYREIDDQLKDRRESLSQFARGASRFCCGLAKKVLVGDALAAGFAYYQAMGALTPTVGGAWMTILLYTGHIYYDFSGYTDMAIGLGHLFGFTFPENFNYPYTAQSISEFWRRWHMTLSSWFREYVYIPLGGNRRGKAIQCRNLLITWALTGFWHGASWNFLLWGLYFGVILIVEHLLLRRLLERAPRLLRHLYTMLLVTVGFLLFSYTDLSAGFACFRSLWGIGVVGAWTPETAYHAARALPLILLAAVGATPWPRQMLQRLIEKKRPLSLLVPLGTAAALLVSVAYLVSMAYSPFAYFNF